MTHWMVLKCNSPQKRLGEALTMAEHLLSMDPNTVSNTYRTWALKHSQTIGVRIMTNGEAYSDVKQSEIVSNLMLMDKSVAMIRSAVKHSETL